MKKCNPFHQKASSVVPEENTVCLNKQQTVVVQSVSCIQLFVTHGLQHARLPCPSPSPRVCSNPCPLNLWCHPMFHPSPLPSPYVFHLSQHQGLFQCIIFTWDGKSIGASASDFQMNIRVDFFRAWLVWLPCNPRDSQVFSSTTI